MAGGTWLRLRYNEKAHLANSSDRHHPGWRRSRTQWQNEDPNQSEGYRYSMNRSVAPPSRALSMRL